MVETYPGDICVTTLREAAKHPDLVERMRLFYAETNRRIGEHSPTCWNRGNCCFFGQFGHRLYVTALETAYYLSADEPVPEIAADACPYAFEGKCHMRDHRPLGCRIYFCDPDAQDWQGPMSEDRLALLRTLHEQFEIPYFYADWMCVLRTLQGIR